MTNAKIYAFIAIALAAFWSLILYGIFHMSQINILIAAIIVLQLADIVTTYLAISSGKGVEANGILAPIFKRLGLVPALLITKGAFIALLIWGAPQIPVGLLVLMTAFYCWVIFNNIKVLQK